MEPTMPNDEDARPVAARRPDAEHQPPQLSVLANHMHGHRSDPGEEGGVPGRYQRPDLELRAAADRAGHPRDREPPRRERRQAASQLRGNAFFGGVPSFERELVEGMNASLARIRVEAIRAKDISRPTLLA